MIWKLKIIAKLSAYFTLCMFQVIFKNEEQLLHAFIFDFSSLVDFNIYFKALMLF